MDDAIEPYQEGCDIAEATGFTNADRRDCKVTFSRIVDREICFVLGYAERSYMFRFPIFCHSRRLYSVYGRIRDNYPKYAVVLDESDMSRNGIRIQGMRKHDRADLYLDADSASLLRSMGLLLRVSGSPYMQTIRNNKQMKQ